MVPIGLVNGMVADASVVIDAVVDLEWGMLLRRSASLGRFCRRSEVCVGASFETLRAWAALVEGDEGDLAAAKLGLELIEALLGLGDVACKLVVEVVDAAVGGPLTNGDCRLLGVIEIVG